jgi:nucleoside-diphosphate-sugar epimerase
MEKVVVFGGSGFIGTHLCKRLAASGESVVSVDLRLPSSLPPGVEFKAHDVRNLEGLDISGPIKRIYNLAAVHTTPGHPVHQYYETNVLGALEVTAFARRRQVTEIIFTSSISIYGPSEETKTELSAPAPVSAYGWSKLLAERAHDQWQAEEPGRRLVTCRPAVVFGLGEGGNFTRLARLLRKGVFVYPGRRDAVKACFYVEDLLDAIETARRHNDEKVLFNGCYPDRYTLEQIVEAFRSRHMPRAHTITLPRAAVTSAAAMLRPVAAAGLGIHPDRVLKLVRSTDIAPQWLQSRQLIGPGRLEAALQHWSAASDGLFV